MKKKEHRRQRQEEAQQRELIRSQRTPEQQLCMIATRRGNSTKEKARLMEQLKAAKEQQKETK